MTAAEFRAMRKRLGLTQASLAECLNVRRETVTRLETAKGPVPAIYEMSLRWLAILAEPSKSTETKSTKTREPA